MKLEKCGSGVGSTLASDRPMVAAAGGSAAEEKWWQQSCEFGPGPSPVVIMLRVITPPQQDGERDLADEALHSATSIASNPSSVSSRTATPRGKFASRATLAWTFHEISRMIAKRLRGTVEAGARGPEGSTPLTHTCQWR